MTQKQTNKIIQEVVKDFTTRPVHKMWEVSCPVYAFKVEVI